MGNRAGYGSAWVERRVRMLMGWVHVESILFVARPSKLLAWVDPTIGIVWALDQVEHGENGLDL